MACFHSGNNIQISQNDNWTHLQIRLHKCTEKCEVHVSAGQQSLHSHFTPRAFRKRNLNIPLVNAQPRNECQSPIFHPSKWSHVVNSPEPLTVMKKHCQTCQQKLESSVNDPVR